MFWFWVAGGIIAAVSAIVIITLACSGRARPTCTGLDGDLVDFAERPECGAELVQEMNRRARFRETATK